MAEAGQIRNQHATIAAQQRREAGKRDRGHRTAVQQQDERRIRWLSRLQVFIGQLHLLRQHLIPRDRAQRQELLLRPRRCFGRRKQAHAVREQQQNKIAESDCFRSGEKVFA